MLICPPSFEENHGLIAFSPTGSSKIELDTKQVSELARQVLETKTQPSEIYAPENADNNTAVPDGIVQKQVLKRVPEGGFQEQVLKRAEMDTVEQKLLKDGFICVASNPSPGYIEEHHQPTCEAQGYMTRIHRSLSSNSRDLNRLWVKGK